MSDQALLESPSLLSKHRIEALSDGVFAVVMTLLVLEIKPEMEPHAGDEAVRHMLWALGLPVLTFAFAFLISCIFWNLHHRKFALLRHTNTVHTTLSLIFLFTVTLLPVSVSIYLHAKTSYLAQAVYYGNFTLIALPLLLSWLYARSAGLVDPAQPPEITRRLTMRMLAVTLLGMIATIASYVGQSYILWLIVPVILYLRHHRPTPAKK